MTGCYAERDPQFLESIKDIDLVIGSRHTKKGSAKKGFSFVRELGSKLAIKFTKLILN